MSYRQDLEAAHRRIAALEAALIERDGSLDAVDGAPTTPSPPTRKRWSSSETAATAKPTIGERLRSGWPLFLLAGLVFWFSDLTTTTITTNATADDAAKSSYVLFGIFGALILVGRLILNIAQSGRSTMAQRIMLIVSIPFLIPAAFVALDHAGMGLGALMILMAALSGAAMVIRWVRLGSRCC